MSDTTNAQHPDMPIADAACEKVAELYNSGNNCDKAVLKVLQMVLDLPENRWDWEKFYSEKPEDTDRFTCKALVAGALGIYLAAVDRWEKEKGKKTDLETAGENRRVMGIFNAMLQFASGERSHRFEQFDPFEHDPLFGQEMPEEALRQSYRAGLSALLNDFRNRFQVQDCVDILGFDPFSYEDYDEKTQEEIESGEWMKECLKCMQHVVACVGSGRGA